MNVTTSNTSHIVLEAWMPSTWNGRFMSTGNGGIGGCIQYNDLAYASSYRFAVVGANNGHHGDTGRPFLNAPEVVEDFAYRSVHTGAVIGKQLTEQFYQSPINHSYYLGCSTGGRQGIKSAQMFPEDYDGIIAGSPATDWNHLVDFNGKLSTIAGFDTSSESFITKPLWELITAEILRQCDFLDGAADGIIEDPDLCHPILESLLCTQDAKNTSSCLNKEQYDRAVKTMEPLYNASGSLIYPALQPGAQAEASSYIFSGQPFPYMSDWYKYVVYNNASWDAKMLKESDITYLDSQDPFNVSTWDVDLSDFSSRGGKIITYHGMQDPAITSANSARFYSHLASTMDLAPNSLDDFYRYFRISGMGHCGTGPGAWDIGQTYTGRNQTMSSPQNNVLEAIVAWVENDDAPEYIEGIKWIDDVPDEGMDFRRRHCMYPKRNVYNGTSNGKDEDGWRCIF